MNPETQKKRPEAPKHKVQGRETQDEKRRSVKQAAPENGNDAPSLHAEERKKTAAETTATQASDSAVETGEQDAVRAPKVSFSQWIRAKWLLDEELPENEYYLRVASRYRFLKYAAIVLTVLLLLGMMAIYSDDITVENFRYLLRDLDSGNTKYTGVYETIQYDGGTDMKFALYRGDLVVVRPGQTAIYGMDAGTVMNEGNDFYSPILVGGEKYFLVYDPGQTSNTYTLYNAFSPLYSKRLDNPIYDGAISDVGTYAIVTEAKGYRGVVEVYDRDFDLLTTISKDKYIWDIVLSKEGDRLLILSASAVDGAWYTEVHLVDCTTFETLMQFTLPELLAYAGHFTDGGGFCLLTENGMRFYDEGNTNARTVSFIASVPVGWSFGDEYQAVFFNRTILGQEKIIQVMKNGETVGQMELNGQITSSLISGTHLFVLTDADVYRIDCETMDVTRLSVEADCRSLLFIDETHLMLCYGDQAVTVDPKTDFIALNASDTNDTTGGENVADT